MRKRPTRPGSSIRISSVTLLVAIAALSMVSHARPSQAAWDGSTGQKILLTGVDMALVRPLAAVRVGVGAVLLVPAALFASPACAVNAINGTDCSSVFGPPYELLVTEPAEYAFERKLGEL